MSKALNANADLILLYSELPDFAQHILYKDYNFIVHSLYPWLDNLASKLRNNKADLIIVSDHGWKIGEPDHSEQAFWSTNFPPPITPRNVKDIATLLLNYFWG